MGEFWSQYRSRVPFESTNVEIAFPYNFYEQRQYYTTICAFVHRKFPIHSRKPITGRLALFEDIIGLTYITVSSKHGSREKQR